MPTLNDLITDATGSDVNINRLVRWARKRGFNSQITIICYPDGWAVEAPELEEQFPALAAKLTQPGFWKRLKLTDLPAEVRNAALTPDEEKDA